MKKFITVQSVYFFLILFTATVPLFLGGCGGGGTATPLANITGTWTLSTSTGNFTFTQINNTISGETPLGQTITGSMSGLNIQFSWVDSTGATHSYTGVVSPDGTSMSGTYTIGSGAAAPWTGTLTTFNITGTWTLSTQVGSWMFTQIGTTLSGQTPSALQITGTIIGLNISFSFTDSSGNTDTYTGTVSSDGTSISGTYTIGSGAAAPWTGTLETSSVSITTGDWSVTEIPIGGTVGTSFTVFLSQSGSTVIGNFPTTSTGQPTPMNTTITGTISGDTITFSFTDSNGLTDTYTGTIVTSNAITVGTYTINGASAGTWLATWTSSI
ncbi:MAG: hypothetical protein ABSA46_12095 [Thermodesulfovibrionales bacterium]